MPELLPSDAPAVDPVLRLEWVRKAADAGLSDDQIAETFGLLPSEVFDLLENYTPREETTK